MSLISARSHHGLSEIGYVEGRNVAIEYRWAEGKNDRLPAFAADLVRLQVAVIMAVSDVSALPAKAATSTIPIVFISGNNPVDFGLVRSLNRPGENVTGVTTLNVEMAARRLELLHQVVPTATSIVALINPTDPPRGGRLASSYPPLLSVKSDSRLGRLPEITESPSIVAHSSCRSNALWT
jgi:putative ABC transport system substrate-binding protein